MSDSEPTAESPQSITRDEALSALFASMVIQQTNLALMLLGRLPHPETGETVRDMEGARLLIDQLEMLETKTEGNRTDSESRLMRQNLTALRMAFVEAVESEPVPAAPATGNTDSGAGAGVGSPAGLPPAPEPGEESRKRFSKKY